jgi:hypothetical protein
MSRCTVPFPASFPTHTDVARFIQVWKRVREGVLGR